jgi:hypothetical protein
MFADTEEQAGWLDAKKEKPGIMTLCLAEYAATI